ncbi:MAG: dimethylaniline monooxygenase (N-oxide forming), partial [Planctomycetota bacterium]
AFAGFNHGFMHVPSVEVAMLWLSALLNNEIQLPSVEKMEQSMSRVLEWKRQNINFEPSRSCAVNTRFQQYIDIMLKDLGVSPYRKMPNVFAELFVQYGASDYKDVFEDYRGSRKNTESPREVMSLDT